MRDAAFVGLIPTQDSRPSRSRSSYNSTFRRRRALVITETLLEPREHRRGVSICLQIFKSGAPGAIRTPDLLLRRATQERYVDDSPSSVLHD